MAAEFPMTKISNGNRQDDTGVMFEQTNDTAKRVVDMTKSNSHAAWPDGCYEEAELSRNCVRSSVTAGADLNHFATLPHLKTSWQSLTLQVTMARQHRQQC